MTSATPKPRVGEHVPDRFGLPEASYQDAMEMGNSLARGIVASPGDFEFDERVLCRAFCLSAKEEILATQRWDTAAAERDSLRARERELVEALKESLQRWQDWNDMQEDAEVREQDRQRLAQIRARFL